MLNPTPNNRIVDLLGGLHSDNLMIVFYSRELKLDVF